MSVRARVCYHDVQALSKRLGLELCRVFAKTQPLEVLCALFYNLPPAVPANNNTTAPQQAPPPTGLPPFSVTFPDAARAIRQCVEVSSGALPEESGGFHVFFITAPLPHNKFSSRKARRYLGWRALDSLLGYVASL